MPLITASDGVRLAYQIDDFTKPWMESEPLILLHPVMGSLERFFGWVPTLSDIVTVIRTDLRGHGNSGTTDDDLNIRRLCDDVGELMDHLGLRTAHLCGGGAGGVIAMAFTLAYPDRVRTCSAFAAIAGLKSSSGRVDYGSWRRSISDDGIAKFLRGRMDERFSSATTDPEMIEWFIANAERADPKTVCNILSIMSELDLRERLEEISVPTLMVAPGDDVNQTDAEYDILKEKLQNCEFIRYSGEKHNVMDSNPKRCATDLSNFLMKNIMKNSGGHFVVV